MDKFIVRFPAGVRDRIATAAKQNGRSMNAEILALINAGFGAPAPNLAGITDGSLLSEVVRRFDAKVQIIVPPAIAEDAGIKPDSKQSTRAE